MWGFSKWKTETWEGKIVNKEVVQSTAGEDDITYFYLYVQMPDGSVEKKKYWDPKFYDSFNVGDRIIKRAGEKKPAKA